MDNDNYRWTPLSHSTRFKIYDNGKFAIPVGATGVDVAFGQSSRPLLRNGKPTSKMQNVYRYKGHIYNA